MDYKVIISDDAINDIDLIAEYISRDSMLYASIVTTKIINATESLVLFPLRGRVVPEFSENFIREIFVYDYRIIYKVSTNIVEVFTITHGKKLLISSDYNTILETITE
jgi:toxin ParE1/3/4